MKSKYICITPFFPSNNSCEGVFIYDQIIEIKKQTKFEIVIIKLSSVYKKESSYKYNGLKVNVFKLFDFPRFYFAGLFSRVNGKRFYSFLKNITDVSSISYIHGHVNYPSAFLISYLKNKISFISIIQHHGLDVYQKLHFKFFQKFFHKIFFLPSSVRILNQFDFVVGVSKKVLDELNRHVKYLPKKELLLYNGVEKSKFFKKKSIKNKNKFVVGCIGNFWKIKGQIFLINAVNLLIKNSYENLQIEFIGSGRELSQLKNYVNKLKLNNHINFREYVMHNKLNEFYNSIDLFVLPSFFEALGCVYIEAWATGTPFIGIENQGISELLNSHQKEKMLAKPKNDDDLAKKILFFYKNKGYKFDFNNELYLCNTTKKFLKNINALS